MFTMVFSIFPNHFSPHLVPNRASTISTFPKFSTPKLFLYLRMLLKYYTATDNPYYLGNTIPRWKRKKKYERNLLLSPAYLSQNHDPWKSPQKVLLPDLSCHPTLSTFDIPEPIPNDISYPIPHDWFSSVPCAHYNTFTPAFGRRTFHPRLQNGVFKF